MYLPCRASIFPLKGPQLNYSFILFLYLFFPHYVLFCHPWGDQKQRKCSVACHVSAAGPHRGQCAILQTDLSWKSKGVFCIWDFRAIKGAVLSANAVIIYTSEPGSRAVCMCFIRDTTRDKTKSVIMVVMTHNTLLPPKGQSCAFLQLNRETYQPIMLSCLSEIQH